MDGGRRESERKEWQPRNESKRNENGEPIRKRYKEMETDERRGKRMPMYKWERDQLFSGSGRGRRRENEEAATTTATATAAAGGPVTSRASRRRCRAAWPPGARLRARVSQKQTPIDGAPLISHSVQRPAEQVRLATDDDDDNNSNNNNNNNQAYR